MTTDDALTTALEISDLILRFKHAQNETEASDARVDYMALRELIMPRLSDLDSSREMLIVSNMIDIADDEFDL